MKSQFQSDEVLKIRFPPFVDLTDGSEITGDACTVTVRKPDNSTATYNAGSSPAVSFDSTIGLWILDIPTGSYAQGEWRIKAVSDAANSNIQRKVLVWGDYVEEIGEDVTVDLSGVTDALETLQNDVTILKKIATGRWKITGSSLVLYDDDNETQLFSFLLKDDDGELNGLRVFERVPVE